MRLCEYLKPELIVLGLDGQGVPETIHALVQPLHQHGVVSDPEALEETLLARENVHTTAMGHGVAVPHTTVAELEQPLVLVAIAPEGTSFGPTGLDPVRVFFLLLSPVNGTSVHIKLLARICRLVRHPGFIERLERATSIDALLEEIERVDGAHI